MYVYLPKTDCEFFIEVYKPTFLKAGKEKIIFQSLFRQALELDPEDTLLFLLYEYCCVEILSLIFMLIYVVFHGNCKE